MILSSPFSRQNRAHQTWTGSNNHHNHHQQPKLHQNLHQANSLSRKPAPKQSAPVCPPPTATTTPAAYDSGYRSLNRLDLLKRRQQQQQQRNLSSLGHYPAAPSPNLITTTGNRTTKLNDQIYAPASIASPSEYYNRKNRQHLNGFHDQSQHYAATSCRSSAGGPPSESGYRSGRESALGQLLDKFDTLRRRARLSRFLSSSKKSIKHNSNSLASPSPANWSNSQSTSSAYHSNGYSTPSGSLINFKVNNHQQLSSKNIPPPPTPLAGVDHNNNNNNANSNVAKKRLEADEIYAEGWRAINENAQRRLLEHQLDVSLMLEGETRTLISHESRQLLQYQQLVSTLLNWINDELAEQRIIVRDLLDDLYDGQILCKLLEKLQQIKLDIIEVTQNELTQKYKLKTCLDTINRILTLQTSWARIRWSVEGIHSKNIVEIVHLLVALAVYYRAPCKLPPNVHVQVVVIQKHQDRLIERLHQVQLTQSVTNLAASNETSDKQSMTTASGSLDRQRRQRDAFDTLIEFAPDKLAIVESALVKFVDRHLNKINMTCRGREAAASLLVQDINNNNDSDYNADHHHSILEPDQFSDGLLLVFLISSLEDYFVPLGNLFTATKTTKPTKSESRTHLNNDHQFIDHTSRSATATATATLGTQAAIETDLDDLSILQTAIEPTSFVNTQPIEKLHNVNVALQLIEDAGIEVKESVRAEDIANGDLKAILRVLYALFSRYKHV